MMNINGKEYKIPSNIKLTEISVIDGVLKVNGKVIEPELQLSWFQKIKGFIWKK